MKKFCILLTFGILAMNLNTLQVSASENLENEITYDTESTNGNIAEKEFLQIDEKGYANLTEKDKEMLAIKEQNALLQPKSSSRYVNVSHQTQQNGYYCGPASASMVVSKLGYNRSQSQMASLLNTTSNGTDAGNHFATAINSVTGGNKFYYLWTWHNYSEVTKIQNNTVTTINSGAPTIINTVESPGDWYIQGHNVGYTLYHYGVIDGYKDNGVSFRYVDPAAGYFGGFIKTQHISGNSMSYAAGGRGYVW